jgi:hypothetical protein
MPSEFCAKKTNIPFPKFAKRVTSNQQPSTARYKPANKEIMVGKFRIAIIESPNPIDAFVGRTEATSLCATSKLLEHEALSFTVHSRQDFRNVCAYLASADSQHCQYDAKPLVVHISAHGDADGVAFGSDNISWKHLADELIPIFKNDFYDGRILISLSACASGDQKIHRTLREKLKKTNKWPQYIFSILGEIVNWDDALIAWTVLYHKLSDEGALKKSNVKDIFTSIESCLNVRFQYCRYDEKLRRFKHWPEVPQ